MMTITTPPSLALAPLPTRCRHEWSNSSRTWSRTGVDWTSAFRRCRLSWRGSLGLHWHKVAATRAASSRERRKMSLLALTERNAQG
jgi:hypothetical protein